MLASGFLVAWLRVAPDIQQGHLVIQLNAVCLLVVAFLKFFCPLQLPIVPLDYTGGKYST